MTVPKPIGYTTPGHPSSCKSGQVKACPSLTHSTSRWKCACYLFLHITHVVTSWIGSQGGSTDSWWQRNVALGLYSSPTWPDKGRAVCPAESTFQHHLGEEYNHQREALLFAGEHATKSPIRRLLVLSTGELVIALLTVSLDLSIRMT